MRQLLPILLMFLVFCSYAQRLPKVDFTHADISISIDTARRSIQGQVEYDFHVLQDVDSVFLDARNMDFSSVLLNGKKVGYTNTGSRISVAKKLKAGKDYRLLLDYTCVPKQTVYFSGWDDEIPDNEQIWTQGQGKYTSHWLPSFDDMEEKVEFDMTIVFDASYQVIANGKAETVETVYEVANEVSTAGGNRTWHYDMEHQMSSYLLAFAIGKYDVRQLTSSSGIPIENYYYPADSLRVEPTYRHTLQIFDFLEEEIGVPYPWQNYKQIPVHDFLYAGMENTGTTILSDGYIIDSTAFVDKNYVNVNAHELAHQWFGNLVTEKDAGHHWLHEGFATYYAYLAERELFGDEHFYWKLYSSLNQLEKQVARGDGESLLNPKAGSLTFYEKGAWALFMLREKIGDRAFKEGIRNYLQKYRFGNVTVADFLEEMEKASGNGLVGIEKNVQNESADTILEKKEPSGEDSGDNEAKSEMGDISGSDFAEFRASWLESDSIPLEDAQSILAKHSASLRIWFDLQSELKNAQGDIIDFAKYWNASPSIHLKKHILENYIKRLPDTLIQKGFASDTVVVRQALAMSRNIKGFERDDFESLLDDDSYLTVESALYKLWEAYPEDRGRYLDKTKNVIGLPNKNVRLLWLTLAISTEGYRGRKTKQFFDELSGYTDSRYSFEVRQGAFFFLKEAFGLTDKNLGDLLKATNHHSWQFRQFARGLLNELLQDTDYKTRILEAAKELNTEDLRYFNSIED